MTSSRSSPWFSLEDARAAFNLFCCVYGIGTLGMPANFARAGPVFATAALLFMAFANVYASVAISRAMLVAPPSVRTYSDLGAWAMGTRGRWAVVVSQLSVCLLVPCAFLVLGGTLLQVLFPDAFGASFWILFMAVMVLPACLIPTLKEGAGLALAGCVATLLSDFIAIGVLMHGMESSPATTATTLPFQAPDVTLHQVLTTFGNLSLAYGAGIVIPDLQRQHSQPQRMPRVIGVTLSFISLLFLVLGSTGYSVVGCRLSGNLLFSITSTTHSATEPSPLGFMPHRGAVIMAFLFMQMHITIAFAVLLHPAFYTAERLLLGMHRDAELYHDIEQSSDHFVAKTMANGKSDEDEDQADGALVDSDGYTGTANVAWYVALRCAIVALLVLLALALQDHFLELADFIGATCISLSCLILPLVFYVRVLGDKLSRFERRLALSVAVVSTLVGLYVVVSIAVSFLKPQSAGTAEPTAAFPFCPATNMGNASVHGTSRDLD